MKSELGSSLIEVMVALLVVSLGMLGIAAFQVKSLSNNQKQIEQSTVVMLSYSILESLRADRFAAASEQKYDIQLPVAGEACALPDSVSGLPKVVLASWLDDIQVNLGTGACGSVDCTSSPDSCEISILWNTHLADSSSTYSTVGQL